MYQLQFLEPAQRALKSFDRSISLRILRKVNWLAQNAEATQEEGLHGDLAGDCKLREGDYRIIYQIDRKEKLIIVKVIGHRSEVYNRR